MNFIEERPVVKLQSNNSRQRPCIDHITKNFEIQIGNPKIILILLLSMPRLFSNPWLFFWFCYQCFTISWNPENRCLWMVQSICWQEWRGLILHGIFWCRAFFLRTSKLHQQSLCCLRGLINFWTIISWMPSVPQHMSTCGSDFPIYVSSCFTKLFKAVKDHQRGVSFLFVHSLWWFPPISKLQTNKSSLSFLCLFVCNCKYIYM